MGKTVFMDFTDSRKIKNIHSTDYGSYKLKASVMNIFGPIHHKDGIGESFFKLLLADETGQIDCIVDAGKFENQRKPKMGENFEFSNFITSRVSSNAAKYNLSPHQFQIRNPKFKRIRKMPEEVHTSIPFKFIAFENIKNTDADLIDVVGMVHHVGLINKRDNYKPVLLKNSRLEDEKEYSDLGTEINLIVWGKEKMQQIKRKGLLIALRKAKIGSQYKNDPIQLQVTQATQIFKIQSKEDTWIFSETQRKQFRYFLDHLPEKIMEKDKYLKPKSRSIGRIESLLKLMKTNKYMPFQAVDVIMKSKRRKPVTIRLRDVKVDFGPDDIYEYDGCPNCFKKVYSSCICDSYRCTKKFGSQAQVDPISCQRITDLKLIDAFDKNSSLKTAEWFITTKNYNKIFSGYTFNELRFKVTLLMEKDEKTKKWHLKIKEFKKCHSKRQYKT